MSRYITIKRARSILNKAHPEFDLYSVVAYKNFYVFDVRYRNDKDDSRKPLLANPLAIDRETGRIIVFNPMDHEPKEYFKEVKNNRLIF